MPEWSDNPHPPLETGLGLGENLSVRLQHQWLGLKLGLVPSAL